MAGADNVGTGPCGGADGVELTLRLGSPAAPAPAPPSARNLVTVDYGGRIVMLAVDVAELQARAIISTANREAKGRLDHGMAAPPPPPANPYGGSASMKRSLQRFLEKRKARVAAAAAPPYVVHHRRPS